MDILCPLSTIPENPSTGCLPENILLRTKGGTIHDVLRAQRMDSNTQAKFRRLAPVINTYDDQDADDMGQAEVEGEELHLPEPGCDSDSGSDWESERNWLF